MNTRNVILGTALVFTLGMGFLTLSVLVNEGLDILVVISLVVLAMFAFGIVGALLNRPEE